MPHVKYELHVPLVSTSPKANRHLLAQIIINKRVKVVTFKADISSFFLTINPINTLRTNPMANLIEFYRNPQRTRTLLHGTSTGRLLGYEIMMPRGIRHVTDRERGTPNLNNIMSTKNTRLMRKLLQFLGIVLPLEIDEEMRQTLKI